jgi:hypothetical protein
MSRPTPQADDPSPEAGLSEADLDEVAGGLQTSSGIRLDAGESTSGTPKSTDTQTTDEARRIQSRSGIVISFDD